MSEQQNNKTPKEKKKITLTKENKLYLYTAAGCAAALLAIVVIALSVAGGKKIDNQLQNASNSSSPAPDSSLGGTDGNEGGNEPVITTPEGMVSPIEAVTVGNDYGFYYNQTLNSYYEHAGVDFTAAVGTEVLAVEDGTVESIYKDNILSGTEIVVNHGDGLKTVYRFVTETSGLKVGDKVEKGEVIATVAEANGNEYKDGAHLHFEILKNNVSVDPATYLTLEEK